MEKDLGRSIFVTKNEKEISKSFMHLWNQIKRRYWRRPKLRALTGSLLEYERILFGRFHPSGK